MGHDKFRYWCSCLYITVVRKLKAFSTHYLHVQVASVANTNSIVADTLPVFRPNQLHVNFPPMQRISCSCRALFERFTHCLQYADSSGAANACCAVDE